MSDETPKTEAAEEPAKKGGKKKLIIMIVAGVLVLGAAAHFTILKPKAASATVAKPVPGKIISVPSQTLNLADGHLLQVGIGLQLTTTAAPAEVTALYPKIDSLTLRTLSPYSYKQMLNITVRDQAQRKLSKEIIALLNAPPPSATATPSATPTSKAGAKAAKKSKKPTKAEKAAAAKAAAKASAAAAAANPPKVLDAFFTTFLMQ